MRGEGGKAQCFRPYMASGDCLGWQRGGGQSHPYRLGLRKHCELLMSSLRIQIGPIYTFHSSAISAVAAAIASVKNMVV